MIGAENLRGWVEDLFLWWKLMSIQIKDHLLFVEIQQESDGISYMRSDMQTGIWLQHGFNVFTQ